MHDPFVSLAGFEKFTGYLGDFTLPIALNSQWKFGVFIVFSVRQYDSVM